MEQSAIAPAWFLYLLRCNDNSLYTGITTDLQRRLHQHQTQPAKGAKYLRGKAPLSLVFSCQLESKSAALQAEARIKRLPKLQKEALVQGALELRELL